MAAIAVSAMLKVAESAWAAEAREHPAARVVREVENAQDQEVEQAAAHEIPDRHVDLAESDRTEVHRQLWEGGRPGQQDAADEQPTEASEVRDGIGVSGQIGLNPTFVS